MSTKRERKRKPSIQNAADIIDRFGGIRPMAKKLSVAATTVQGWKKRGAIPGARREQLEKAAKLYDLDLGDLLKKRLL